MLEAGEQIDVDERPEEPGQRPAQTRPAEVEDRRVPSNDRRIAAVMEDEIRRGFAFPDTFRKCAAEIMTFLLRDLSQARQLLAGGIAHQRDIAECIDIREARHRKVT